MPVTRDIICFANDWSGDPLSKKQVMLRLARQHRVLWINSMNNRRPRLARKDFRRVFEKLRDFRHGLKQVQERIWVLAPLYVPFHRRAFVRSFNRRILGWQIGRALQRLRFMQPITYAFLPSSADVVGTLGERLIVYHCVDEYGAFSDAAGEIRERERELLAKADLVLVCSSPLVSSKREHNPRTYLVTHGVDYEHFRRATEDSTPVAPELRALPRPILGFHGMVADWVDLSLIGELARLRPEWSIVLVGRVDTDLAPIRGLHNVHVLGHRPYERLPEYLRGFDVALLPFVANELTRNANPLKLREYLAAGLPVVAAPLPEVARMAKMDGLVSLAATAEEYARHITTLLEQGVVGPSRHRSEKMADESWDCKVAEIERLLATALTDGIEHRLNEHPLLRGKKVELVRRSQGRHSELLEYQSRSEVGGAAVIVKRITKFRTPAEAEEDVIREFNALETVRKRMGSVLEGSLPLPLVALPEAKAIMFEKLPGIPLSVILKRHANWLTGRFRQRKVCEIARLVGRWLRQFHESMRQPPARHDSRMFLAKLTQQLDRCAAAVLSPDTALRIRQLACRESEKADGQIVPRAARHGDFIPQNILVDRCRVALVDFENFSECDVIYEDVSTLIAYLTVLGGSPLYSPETLEEASRSFIDAYGEWVRDELLNLYVLKGAVTIAAEFQPRKGILGGWGRAYLLRRQLVNCSRELLQGRSAAL